MAHEEAHREHINKHKMAHMIGVAEYMRERADDYDLDKDEMYVLGMLHDIGYVEGRREHEAFGAELLWGMGLSKNYVDAIRNHGKNPYEIYKSCEAATPEAVLLLEADMSVEIDGYRVGFEKRLKDIGNRYGYNSPAYKNAVDNIAFIKEFQKEHHIEKPYNLYHKNNIER